LAGIARVALNFLKFSSKHWLILAVVQMLLAWYFFSNIQVYLVYQTLPSGLFGEMGFNHFIIGTLFFDAMIFFILTLPFTNHNALFNIVFLSLLITMSLTLNTDINYLFYLIFFWFFFSYIFFYIHLFLLKFFKTKWLFHIIATGILLSLWLTLPLEWTVEPFQEIPNQTKMLLEQLTKPLEIKAFISNENPLKKRLIAFVERYQQLQPKIKLNLIQPQRASAQIKAFSIEQEGELLLQYDGNITRVEKITDYAITKGLQTLLHLNKTKIVFLEGHGERSVFNDSPFEISQLNRFLQNQNIEIVSQTFPPDIDRETLLVIAHPRQPLNHEESEQILAYIQKGGNLLWLIEPILEHDGLSGLNKIADFLGLKILDGRVWDHHKKENNSLIEIDQFQIFDNMRGLKVNFPEVAALQIDNILFNSQTIFKIPELRLKPFEMEKSEENHGVLNIGFALQRNVLNDKKQRIIVIGDSDFVSNAYLETAHNKKFAMEIMSWLTENKNLIHLPTNKIHDTKLTIDFNLQSILTAFFLFVLPLIFIIISYRTSKTKASK
jgi:hypothetical protein